MYFFRLMPNEKNKKVFIFGEVEKTENHYVGIYKIYLKNGIGFYNNEIENIDMVNAASLKEIRELDEISKILIKYLFGEL